MTLVLNRTRVFREGVRVGMVLFARSIKPLERSRPWLRRTRALMEIEWGKTAVRSVAEAVRYSRADDSDN
jgi:hypothetical protein